MAKKLYDENGNVVKGAKVKKPFYKRWWFILLVVLVIGGALAGGDEDTTSEEATTEEPDTEVVADADEETTEEVVEEEPEEPAQEFDNVFEEKAYEVFEDRMRSVEIRESEGLSYVNVDSDISIGWNEQTSRDSFYRETASLLELVKDEEFDEINILGWAEMQDQLGNTEDMMVLSSRFTKGLVNEINYENFNAENIPNVADGSFIHPAFQD